VSCLKSPRSHRSGPSTRRSVSDPPSESQLEGPERMFQRVPCAVYLPNSTTHPRNERRGKDRPRTNPLQQPQLPKPREMTTHA
jgi:hypothetical protein